MSKNVNFIPSNSIGVLSQPRPADHYENAFDAVISLLENHKVRKNRFLIEVLEFIASENMKGVYPTSRKIKSHFSGYSNEYLKKRLTAFKKYNFIKVTGKEGKFEQFVLSNILSENKRVKQLEKVSIYPDDLKLQLEILRDFIDRESPLIHNIKLLTQLRYRDDYYILNWQIRSAKNRAKVFERRISQFRKYTISVQKTGTVIIDISCTNDPFDLCTVEGITNFYGICGEILGEIRKATSRFLTAPLTSEISDWTLSQYDESFDIPLSGLNKAMVTTDPDGKGSFGWKLDGCMKVKYLSHLVRLYTKTTTRGVVLRLEQRRSFPNNRAPTTRELQREFLNIIIENALDGLDITKID